MDEDENTNTDNSALARHLFAVATAMLEDAASIAAAGQSRLDDVTIDVRAAMVEALSEKSVAIARAIRAL